MIKHHKMVGLHVPESRWVCSGGSDLFALMFVCQKSKEAEMKGENIKVHSSFKCVLKS